ncbi:MAG: fluoride efflux transporter CrcB [Muribaculaceae bacterium]
MIKSMLMAGIGGFIGSCARYLVGKLTAEWPVTPFPIGTFAVNIIGCLLIGIFFGLAQRTNIISQNLNVLLITGFCGGFTTFSTFSNEIFILAQAKQWITCSAYLILSIIAGVAMVWFGRSITQ